jgi:hypothetical protein
LKSKGKTYLLLVAVLGIWGTIAYKIVNSLSPDEVEVTPQNFDVSFNPKQPKQTDTFSIKDTERDPFLGTLSSNKQTSRSVPKSTSAKTDVAMPAITFGGLIQKQGSNSKVFVVNINNRQYLLKRGQTVNDVKLINGDKESITIRFNGKNHNIKL